MVTVGSSSLTPVSVEPNPSEAAPNGFKKRLPLMAVPITLSVGLLVAAGYVGNRVITSRAHHAVAVVSTFTSVPAASPLQSAGSAPVPAKAEAPQAGQMHVQATAAPAAAPSGASSPSAAINPLESTGTSADSLIEPRPGERYLQIAAISASAAKKYVAGLGRYNIQARVAPGPHDGLVRVVIGPFPDRDSVAAVKAQIQAMWPDCFVRLY